MIERFSLKDHYELVASWWRGHDMRPPRPALLPPGGFVVDRCVAGFLYQTNSALVLFENFVSDPAAERGRRRDAVDTLCEVLLLEAKTLGALEIVAITQHPAMKERARRFGFFSSGEFTVLTKEI